MREDPEEGALSRDKMVSRDEHVFKIDYAPETFNHRESQSWSLKCALRPAVRGSRPLNMTVRGLPGMGKTTAVQKLFGESGTQSGVWTVRVNCQVDSARYVVFSRVFEHIFEYESPSSGISLKKPFGQITDRLVEDDEVLVVVLDNVNHLFYENEASDTFHSLLRAHKAYSGARIGVIIISSDLSPDVINELDGRVQNVFRPEEVFFPHYDVDETVDILHGRLKRDFHEDVIGASGLDQVAEFTVDSGDPRVGIDLLRCAVPHAEMRASRIVDMENTEAAYDKLKYVHLSRCLQGLPDPERELVRVVAEYDGERAGAAYDTFNEATGLDYTRRSELVNKLDQLGVTEVRYTEIEGHSHTRAISLAYDADAVLDHLRGRPARSVSGQFLLADRVG